MKIPPQAKKVFDGVMFDVYQWEQEMFDGSTATFEMLKRPDTTQIIATDDEGKIIVIHEEQPYKGWFNSFVGGQREEGEDPLEAAKRELLEEAGMVSDDWELYRTWDPVTKMEWTIYTYIARNCRKVTEQKLDSGERIEILQLEFDDFVQRLSNDEFRADQLAIEVLRMRLEPEKLEAFRKKIFK